jgi:hypothetical protein
MLSCFLSGSQASAVIVDSGRSVRLQHQTAGFCMKLFSGKRSIAEEEGCHTLAKIPASHE